MVHTGDKFTDQGELFNAESLRDVTDEVMNEISDAKLTADLISSFTLVSFNIALLRYIYLLTFVTSFLEVMRMRSSGVMKVNQTVTR